MRFLVIRLIHHHPCITLRERQITDNEFALFRFLIGGLNAVGTYVHNLDNFVWSVPISD